MQLDYDIIQAADPADSSLAFLIWRKATIFYVTKLLQKVDIFVIDIFQKTVYTCINPKHERWLYCDQNSN